MATATKKQIAKTVPFTIAPITYEVQKEMIEQLAEQYLPLTVANVNDKQGIAIVREARLKVRDLRLGIEKRRKELNSEALAYGQNVDAAARELTELLLPIEEHLKNEESIVAREEERLAKEAEETRQKMIRSRLEMLAAQAIPGSQAFTTMDVEFLEPSEWEEMICAARTAKAEWDEQERLRKAEQERIAAQQKAEAERLAKERAEFERQQRAAAEAAAEQQRIAAAKLAEENAKLEAQRKEQAEAQAKIDAENKRIANEEAARVRAAELEKAKAKAAEEARLEEIARQERAAAEAKAQADAAEAQRLKIEAAKPDQEKLQSLSDALLAIEVPQLSDSATVAQAEARKIIEHAARDIRVLAGELVE